MQIRTEEQIYCKMLYAAVCSSMHILATRLVGTYSFLCCIYVVEMQCKLIVGMRIEEPTTTERVARRGIIYLCNLHI